MGLKTRRMQFVSMAMERISVDTGESERQVRKVKKKVAVNMYRIVKYAARIGMRMDNTPPMVKVTAHDGDLADGADASYLNGRITIRAAVVGVRDGVLGLRSPWKSGHTLAHEMFHAEQERAGNGSYLTGLERAYVEGGADFFAHAYTSRHPFMQLYSKKGYILNQMDSGIGSGNGKRMKNGVKEVQKEFARIGEKGKTEFLVRLLRPDSKSDYPEFMPADEPNFRAKYVRGNKFAAISFMSNRYNVGRTVTSFLENGPEEHIDLLCNMKPNSTAREFIGLLRSYPLPTWLGYKIGKHIKSGKKEK